MKENSDVGFIPSPVKLEALRQQASAARGTKGLYSARGGSLGNLGESGMPSRGSTPPTPGILARPSFFPPRKPRCTDLFGSSLISTNRCDDGENRRRENSTRRAKKKENKRYEREKKYDRKYEH